MQIYSTACVFGVSMVRIACPQSRVSSPVSERTPHQTSAQMSPPLHDGTALGSAFETGDEAPNPLPTKAVLRHLGLPAGQARLPMGPAPAWVDERVPAILANLERWRSAFPERPA